MYVYLIVLVIRSHLMAWYMYVYSCICRDTDAGIRGYLSESGHGRTLLCLPHGQHYTTGIQDTTSTHASVPYVYLSHMRYSFS